MTTAGTRTLAVARAAAFLVVVGAVVSPPLANLAAAVLLVAFALVPGAGARLARVLREPLGRGVLVLAAALLLAAGIALARGVAPAQALRALLDWRQLAWLLLALALFDDAASRRRFALAFVALALAGALAALVALQAGYSRHGEIPAVVLRNTVTQALTFAIGAYLALLLAVTRRAGDPARRGALALAGVLLLAMLLFVETGRSGQLAFAILVVASVVLLLRGRALLVTLLAVALGAAAAYAASPLMQQRFAQGATELRHAAELPEYTSMGARVIIWQTAGEMLRERPIAGIGLGGFAPAYRERVEARYTGWKAHLVTEAHNQYLTTWIEAGLAGLVALAVFLIAAWRQGRAAAMADDHDPLRVAGIALLLSWCATSLFSSHFQAFSEGHLIALFLGVFLARDRRPLAPRDGAVGSGHVPAAVVTAVTAGVQEGASTPPSASVPSTAPRTAA